MPAAFSRNTARIVWSTEAKTASRLGFLSSPSCGISWVSAVFCLDAQNMLAAHCSRERVSACALSSLQARRPIRTFAGLFKGSVETFYVFLCSHCFFISSFVSFFWIRWQDLNLQSEFHNLNPSSKLPSPSSSHSHSQFFHTASRAQEGDQYTQPGCSSLSDEPSVVLPLLCQSSCLCLVIFVCIFFVWFAKN